MNSRITERAAEKYGNQLAIYVEQFKQAILAKTPEHELDEIYTQLDKAWRRTARFVNEGNRPYNLDPDSFKRRVEKMVQAAHQAAADKAAELAAINAQKNAPRDFIAEVITVSAVVIIVAIAAALLFINL